MVEAGLGLGYSGSRARKALLTGGCARSSAYSAEVPGLFLYYPGRSVSRAFRAFIEVCREVTGRRSVRRGRRPSLLRLARSITKR